MRVVACAMLTGVVSLGCAGVIVAAPPAQEPGGTAADTEVARTNPDEYAWRLFLSINRQAETGRAGVADSSKSDLTEYESDTESQRFPVVWETWALASGTDLVRNDSEVFRRPAIKPVSWDELPRGSVEKVFSTPVKDFVGPNNQHHMFNLVNPARSCIIPTDVAGIGFDEIRMNRAMYDAIRDQGLYSLEGLEAAYSVARATKAARVAVFPQAAKEVKARWVRIDPGEKDAYHYRIVKGKYYGLVALHIITHDLENWFWCDFSHIESDALPSNDPKNTRKDSTTQSTSGVRKETIGSVGRQKWSNYRLRGTQIAYTDAEGKPTLLANPRLEADFQRSSCIGCHALASVGLRSEHPAARRSMVTFDRGAAIVVPDPCQVSEPDASRFVNGDESTRFIQIGFVWSIPFRVFPANESPPTEP